MPLIISAKIGDKDYSFLIDTGSSLSLLPFEESLASRIRPTAVTLTNASGDLIRCYGEVDVDLGVRCIRRSFPWSFVVADVIRPILGTDFLADKGLVVDCRRRMLFDSTTLSQIPLHTSNTPVCSYSSTNYDSLDHRVQLLLMQFPVLTSPLQLSNVGRTSVPVSHCINTNDCSPVQFRARPLTGEKLSAAKKEFQFLLNAGIIQRSNSPWASPLHLVPKKEPGSWRPCGDYRGLNSITVDDKYPIPHLRSLTMSLHDKKLFSKLDLQKAYLQIPVAEKDIPKTAVCTPFGLFEYKFMPYGLKNAGSTFQRFMDTILANTKNVICYLDDILVASSSVEEHLKDLENVLALLHKYNLRLAIDKCEFLKSSLTFLGYEVSSEGVKPPLDKVKAITEFPLPRSSTDLRRFMGMMNFFRQMIKDFATIAFPLTELLRHNSSCKSLKWSDAAKESFSNLKQALSTCPTLAYPSPISTHYQLVTDSSSVAVGGALYQMVDSQPAPLGFFSKKLSDTQKKYSTYDRELLAAYLAVIHFKSIIDGHSVTLFLDHKPIVSSFYSTSIAKSDRQQRQLSYISEYVSHVEFIRGSNNVVADCLSRPSCAISVDAFDLHGIARAQETDTELQTYKDRLTQFHMSPDLILWCDTSTNSPRPFVPSSLRNSVIASLHNLSHPGVKGSSRLVKQRYFWSCMDADIKNFVKHCVNCQQAKVHRHTKSPVIQISAPTDRFQTVHIDIVGPLPPAKVSHYPYPLPYNYILTCIDRATRWTEAIPLVDTTAASVAIAFVSGWVSRFGVPLHVVTDRGPQFESELFSELSSVIGFHHIRTTSYHPQANGIIERHHRLLKSAIRARKENWFHALPIVLLGYRMIPNDTGFSPFTAVTGSHMICPQPLIAGEYSSPTSHDTLQMFIKEMQSINFSDFSSGDCHSLPEPYIPSDLFTCPKVWMRVDRIRKSLEAPYTGPYTVLRREPKFFILELPQGNTSVSIDRLKPAYIPSPEHHFPAAPDIASHPNTSSPLPTVDLPTPTSPAVQLPHTTRSGRTVRFNQQPDFYYY